MKKKLEIGTKTLKQMGADMLEAWKNAEAGPRACQRIEAGFSNVPETEGLAEIEAAVEIERAQARSPATER